MTRIRKHRLLPGAIAVAVSNLLLMSACTQTQSERGVEPRWQQLAGDTFTVGQTTQTDVMQALGPPSQVIADGNGTIFYYLYEKSSTRGLILILYNKSTTDTRYDRAIFFFDADGILEEFSVSAPSTGS